MRLVSLGRECLFSLELGLMLSQLELETLYATKLGQMVNIEQGRISRERRGWGLATSFTYGLINGSLRHDGILLGCS